MFSSRGREFSVLGLAEANMEVLKSSRDDRWSILMDTGHPHHGLKIREKPLKFWFFIIFPMEIALLAGIVMDIPHPFSDKHHYGSDPSEHIHQFLLSHKSLQNS